MRLKSDPHALQALFFAFFVLASASIPRLLESDDCRLQGRLDQFGFAVFTCPKVKCDDQTPCELFVEDETNPNTGLGTIVYTCTCGLQTSPANACLAVGRIVFTASGRYADFDCIHPDWCDPLPNGDPPLSCIRTEIEDWALSPVQPCKC